MKEGDLVWIYKDPWAKTIPEGEARLLKLILSHKYHGNYWLVRFLKDNKKVEIIILED